MMGLELSRVGASDLVDEELTVSLSDEELTVSLSSDPESSVSEEAVSQPFNVPKGTPRAPANSSSPSLAAGEVSPLASKERTKR